MHASRRLSFGFLIGIGGWMGRHWRERLCCVGVQKMCQLNLSALFDPE